MSVERLLLAGTVALITIGAFENIAVTTVMPVVARELDGYELYALAAGLPMAMQVVANALGGIMVDRVSYKRPLVLGVALASLGMLMAGIAPSMVWVAIGRGVGGFGVGLMIVAIYGAVALAVTAEHRPMFFAAFSAAWVVPGMVGPAIAGFLAEAGLWRWIFLGVIPLMLGILLFLKPLFGSEDDFEPRPHEPGRLMKSLVFTTVLAAGLAVFQSSGADGSISVPMIVLSLAAVTVTLPLVLPKGTFTLALGVPSAVGSRFLINGAVIATEAFLPLLLQEQFEWTATKSGLVLTAGSISWFIGSALQTRIRSTQARHRWTMAGALLVTIGVSTTMTVLVGAPPVIALFAWFLAGFGMGVAYASMSVFALDNAPKGTQGFISAALQIADGAGASLTIGAVGIALIHWGRTLEGYGIGFTFLAILAALSIISTSRVRKVTGSEA